MKIVVCIRQGLDGEINPFDACCYEAALQIKGAEITLLTMGTLTAKDFLTKLTRLGAKRAVLLSDKAFAGADTLATAYTLSLAIKKLEPQLIFCGRQTLVGDTAQTGPMLSVFADTKLITNVMKICEVTENSITCNTRENSNIKSDFPALLTIERINTLRFPSLRSKPVETEVWSAADIGADTSKTGLTGSPTRVLETVENQSGKRKCKFISPDELKSVIDLALSFRKETAAFSESTEKLDRVFVIGREPLEFAKSISEDITVIDKTDEETIAEIIKNEKPNAVLWASDFWSKKTSARVAARLNLGLCADCTSLQTDGVDLFMIRPALSGSVIAKIKSLTKPAMATVRTVQIDISDIIVAAGFGTRDNIEKVKSFAQSIGATLDATRKAVDNNILPYELQVGLTGKTVSPPIYIAVGVSGAVHHIVGMERAGVVIAINPDKNAPIFDYADYGIVANFEDIK